MFYCNNRNGETFEVKFSICDLDTILNFNRKVCVWFNKNNNQYYPRISLHLGKNEDGKYISKCIRLHKYIMGLEDKSRKYQVDHINHDTLDNRRENLRIVEARNNSTNRKGKNSNNKSGYRNVQWDKRRNKWSVIIQINGKANRLGSFDDVHDAGEFAEKMRYKYYGEYAGNGD